MQRIEVINKLRRAEPTLRKAGVAALYLFGSHARDEASAHSDVDVFVDAASDERFGFIEYMDAYDAIRKSIGDDVAVGYSTREGLSPYVRARIESEAIRVF